MWQSFYAGITTTGPILAMLLFMLVFAAAVIRSFMNHQSEDERALIPLQDAGVVNAPSSEVPHVS